MKIVRGLRNLTEKPVKPVITLGNFDGVHVGHKEIFLKVIEHAKNIGGTSVVYTFDPHPLKILAPERNLTLLTTFKKKMELIAACGIDMTICADFTREFARMHPRDFAKKLKGGLDMDVVYVGHDYSFGRGKSGTIDYLKKMGAELGFDVEVVDAVNVDGERVSSSAIRSLLVDGNIRKATRFLGRYYSIAGKVVSGYHRGKTIGFPTANLDTPYELIPAIGVYAVFARVSHGKWHRGVVNIGYNPTFNRDDFIVEVHLLDHEEDIYGSEIEIYFVERLRDEQTFKNVEALKGQITKDVVRAKKILEKELFLETVINPRIVL
ncbi:FMN adenylyltransferase / Riboflavin kinase [hydrothermal vent metagenome]|uniref:Bifunctional riboflavin kinase/FMN adenylyltransferase n=1 Tax=hydrothermal vent metagenome TaxID=652676 RepID=A0A3B1BKV1_9ZZZZ